MSRIVTRLPTSLSNFITKTYFKGKNFTRFQLILLLSWFMFQETKPENARHIQEWLYIKYHTTRRQTNLLENNLKMGSFVVDKYRKVGSRGAHCISQTINQDKMRVKILPALSDNYMYLVSLIKDY